MCRRHVRSARKLLSVFSLLSGLATPGTLFAAACVPPATNLVSWWRMETNLLDSWDSNNGSAVVGPTYVAGRVGFAISNSVVTVPDAPSLHSTTGLTVQAWINGSSFASGFYTIISKFETPSITAT